MFENGFANAACRVFDELLMGENSCLCEKLFKELEIRSEVFVVEWFFTFFSRGISPMTILKVWDLVLYHWAVYNEPEVVMYKLSLIILSLL